MAKVVAGAEDVITPSGYLWDFEMLHQLTHPKDFEQ